MAGEQPGLNVEARTAAILETVPVSVAAGSGNKQVIDARGFAKIVVFPASGGTVTYSAVHSLAASAHGADQTGPSSADATVSIDVAANFYMIEAGTAAATVHRIP